VVALVATASRTVLCTTPRAVAAAEFRALMAPELAPTTAEALGAKAAAVSRDAMNNMGWGWGVGAGEAPSILQWRGKGDVWGWRSKRTVSAGKDGRRRPLFAAG